MVAGSGAPDVKMYDGSVGFALGEDATITGELLRSVFFESFSGAYR